MFISQIKVLLQNCKKSLSVWEKYSQMHTVALKQQTTFRHWNIHKNNKVIKNYIGIHFLYVLEYNRKKVIYIPSIYVVIFW